MTITEKAAYIKGLVEGLELDNSSKEGKVLLAVIDMISDMAEDITDIAEDIEYLDEYIEELDEDLGALEEYVYELDDECDCECECDDCECDCDDCDCDCEYNDSYDEEYFEVECPSCGETVCFDSTIDPEELTCPSCGEKFECIISEDDLDTLDAE